MRTHEIDIKVKGISVELKMDEVNELRELLMLNDSGDTLKAAIEIYLFEKDQDVWFRLNKIIEVIETITKAI